MPNYGPSNAFLFVTGAELSGYTFDMSEGQEHAVQPSHGLGDTMEESLPVGIMKTILETGNGFYDESVGNINAAYQSMGATRQLACYGFAGKTLGKDAIIIDGTYANQWKRTATRDGITLGKATHTVDGRRWQGKIVHPATAVTADGNTQSTPVDNAASSASGGVADLHVAALTLGGYTSVTVKVRHSADNVTYADLCTFTVVTAIGFAERQTIAGTINRYLAISYEFNGAGSGQSISPLVVVARG